MPKSIDPYKQQRALGRRARDFYVAECPYCWAPVGQHCYQKSIFEGRGEKRFFPPHSARVNKVLEMEKQITEVAL